MKELERLMKRFKNAQRRARYWSGTPSFSIGARAKATHSGRMDEKYELAMCDQDSLARDIIALGGEAKVRDFKQEFRAKFSKFMGSSSSRSTGRKDKTL